jgi:CTP synthase
LLKQEKIDDRVCAKLGIRAPKAQLKAWKNFLYSQENASRRLRIGVIGKYVDLKESYKSLHEALIHASAHLGAKLEIEFIDSEKLENSRFDSIESREKILGDVDGILVPGGFGSRGVEGKMRALEYGRNYSVPCFGICLGLQLMAIEFARHVLGMSDAHSTEFSLSSTNPVIALMDEQMDVTDLGGTMRLGAYPAMLDEGSVVAQLYGTTVVSERHRHRYEFNSKYREQFEASGFMCSGSSPDGRLIEFSEIPTNSYYVGTQAHPEFKSRPDRAHPLFFGLLQAAAARGEGREPHIIDPASVDATL